MDATFTKSAFCSADSPQCVEARQTEAGGAEVRDTKTGGVLSFTAPEWDAFTAGVKSGQFDL
jgi:hypothetical protein